MEAKIYLVCVRTQSRKIHPEKDVLGAWLNEAKAEAIAVEANERAKFNRYVVQPISLYGLASKLLEEVRRCPM